jgi:hypothetical protein
LRYRWDRDRNGPADCSEVRDKSKSTPNHS